MSLLPRRRITDIFNEFENLFDGWPFNQAPVRSPRTQVTDECTYDSAKQAYQIKVNAAGYSKDQLAVAYDHATNHILITCTKNAVKWTRTFSVLAPYISNQITAEYKDGLLTVTIPLVKPEPTTTSIPIV